MRTRIGLAAAVIALVLAALAPAAPAKVRVSFERLKGFDAAATPSKYDKVGVLKVGPRRARNVLVLNPGTSASASYFVPLAKDVVRRAKGWQVWAVERRENLLEDHSVFNRAKAGKATPSEVFDYYLQYLTDSSITNHFQSIPAEDVAFARAWGMRVEIEDLRRVVKAAKRLGGRVALGGHSLGGSITTAYATWDFNGKAGARDLHGLVFIDGGSGPTPVTPEAASQSLEALAAAPTPWLTFGGIPAPLAGLFNTSGALSVLTAPDDTSIGWAWSALPANLKPPVEPTNEAQYGYALDTATSPAGLVAAQAHLGRLAASGTPRPWERAGELTPIRRYAQMFAGWGLKSLDGTAWYHPQRLTIDSGAVAAGNANPAQDVLDVRATHGKDLPKRLWIYAFAGSLGAQRVLDAASNLAGQSGIPRKQVKLVDRHTTYSHNDPNSASPKNAFVDKLIPILGKIARR
jgi:hypothetical protein